MKKIVLIMIVFLVGISLGAVITYNRLSLRYAESLAKAESKLESEKQALMEQLAIANSKLTRIQSTQAPKSTTQPASTSQPTSALAVVKQDANSLLNSLLELNNLAVQDRERRALVLLEMLANMGKESIPTIREFLSQNIDIPLQDKGGKGKKDSVLPRSIRVAMFEVLQRIGGAEAEQILLNTLNTTGKPDEIVALVNSLEKMSPGTYRDTALSRVHALLSDNIAVSADNPKAWQDAQKQLYKILAQYNDTSYVASAQNSLIQADGHLNGAVLDYLISTLKEKSLPIITQALQDQRITEPKEQENLLRALTGFVGIDQQANQIFYNMLSSPNFPNNLRDKLFKGLEKQGLTSPDMPNERDLEILTARAAILQAVKQSVQDQTTQALADKAYAKLVEQINNAGQAGQGNKLKPDKQPKIK